MYDIQNFSNPPDKRLWWTVPLVVVVVGFIALSLPPYLTLDPTLSRVPTPPGFPIHYGLLVAHVIFGAVAMMSGCLQVWPGLRQRAPAAHRISGQVYVFAGVVPGGVTGLMVGATSPFGHVAQVSNVVLALLWLGSTLAGLSAVRRGSTAGHCRWMTRSLALTMSVIVNRLLAIGYFLWLGPQLHTSFGGDESRLIEVVAGLSAWSGWTLSLITAQWWLDRQSTS